MNITQYPTDRHTRPHAHPTPPRARSPSGQPRAHRPTATRTEGRGGGGGGATSAPPPRQLKVITNQERGTGVVFAKRSFCVLDHVRIGRKSDDARAQSTGKFPTALRLRRRQSLAALRWTGILRIAVSAGIGHLHPPKQLGVVHG